MTTKIPTKANTKRSAPAAKEPGVNAVISILKRMGTKATRDGMARYAITSDRAFGVTGGDIRKLGKKLGRNHELAQALWNSGWLEARMLSAFVADPRRVTPAEMDRWCKDFDNWAICDTLCFHLWDRTPHAFRKIEQWSKRREEFVKRAAFALLASVAGHDKQASDEEFLRCLPLIEAAATDDRNFVKKGVSWALRGVGRRSLDVHKAAVDLANRLASSTDRSERWIGKDALRDLMRPMVISQLKKKAARR